MDARHRRPLRAPGRGPAAARGGPRADVAAPRSDRRRASRPGSRRSACGSSPPRRIGRRQAGGVAARWHRVGSLQRADALTWLIIAGGQGEWIGKILRFGHMGEVGIDEMAEAIEIIGRTLPDHGHPADASAAGRATREAFEAAAPRPHDRRGVTEARLVLVRHGVTDWNREGRFQGHRDPHSETPGATRRRSSPSGSRATIGFDPPAS